MPSKNTADKKTSKKANNIPSMLVSDSVPWEHRKKLLMHMCMDESDETSEVLHSILKAAGSAQSPKSIYTKKVMELEELMQEMKSGPLRTATYLGSMDGNGTGSRASVALEDGSKAFIFVPDEELASSLRRGDSVLIEASGKAVLSRDPYPPETGERARLERCLDSRRIEVSLRDHERFVFLASEDLCEQLEADQVKPGSYLLVCTRRMMAYTALPAEDELSHFRFLDRRPVPDIVPERDLGAPPAYIEELTEHVRQEMLIPEMRRRYRLPRCELRFLSGVSGSGKTYSLMALERRIYEVMAEITGTPVEQLPHRVLRLRPGQFLSKWLGESDQNLERFFDEIEQLAAKPFVAADGTVHELPVLVVLEEVDGLARQRGQEAIYDRIMTTVLQRLDPSRPELRDAFAIVVATSNVAHQCDHAFLRRVSGKVENFGRLSRAAFCAVLAKHIRGLPMAGVGGSEPISEPVGDPASYLASEAERSLLAEVSGWLFRPEDQERPLVEIECAGSAQPIRKYRRDFLTASLIERTVHQAARLACQAEIQNGDREALNPGGLITALDSQIRSVVNLLHTINVRDYVDLPDGIHVVSLRRIEQPSLLPHQILGAA